MYGCVRAYTGVCGCVIFEAAWGRHTLTRLRMKPYYHLVSPPMFRARDLVITTITRSHLIHEEVVITSVHLGNREAFRRRGAHLVGKAHIVSSLDLI